MSKKLSTGFAWFLLIAIPITIYILILNNHSPNWIRPLSINLRFSFNIYIFIMFLLLWGSFALKGWWGRWVSLSVVLAVFALALAGIWASGQSDALIVAGLLPISDAHGYFLDANLLLNNDPYSVFSSRRPLFAGLLAVLLKAAGLNLQLTVSILVLITAIGGYAAARAVRRSSGPLAASIFFMILFLFYRRFAGTTMTENLGLSLGALGFAMIWSYPVNKKPWFVIFGIGILTLGLIARAGPFFILLGILVWAAIIFHNHKLKTHILTGLCILAVVLGFAINYLMFLTLGNPDGVLFTNFSYSFYGLVTGGQRWDAIYQEHPEVFTLAENEQPPAIYKLAFENIKQNPMNPLKGIIKQYGYLVSDSWYNAYSYVSNDNDKVDMAVQYLLMVLVVCAILLGWKKRKEPHLLLAFLMFAGVIVSVPFVPPGDTNRMRAYATVIPVFAILPALGVILILQKIRLTIFTRPVQDDPVWDATPLMSVILLIMITFLPVLLRWNSRAAAFSGVSCESGVSPVYLNYAPGSYVQVQKESDFFLDWLPNFHQGRYTINIHSMPYMDLMAEFLKVEAPMTIFTGNDLKTNRPLWVFTESNLLPSKFGLIGLCGHFRSSKTGQTEGFFDASSIQLLQPAP